MVWHGDRKGWAAIQLRDAYTTSDNIPARKYGLLATGDNAIV